MAQDMVNNDLLVTGSLNAVNGVYSGIASITDAMISATAGIQVTKMSHQHEKSYSNTDAGTAAVSEQRVVHVVYGATGTVLDFRAGAVVPLTGNDTCTVDLLKNGTSILSAAVGLASTDTAYQKKTATLSGNSLVAGDVLEVKVIATHNTGSLPKGVFAQLTLSEKAF